MAGMRTWMVAAMMGALVAGGGALAAEPAKAPDAGWTVLDQPGLKAEVDRAPLLKPQILGPAVRGVDPPSSCGYNLVPHPDGSGYDALLWYRKEYRHNTCLYAVDLVTGKVRKQSFAREDGRMRMEMGFTWWGAFDFDGKLYAANPDWSKWDRGGAMNIYRYDPATKQVTLFLTIPGHGGERNPLVTCPNGWIYGAATYCDAANKHNRASAYGFNPKTGEVRNFGDKGAIGPEINSDSAYAYYMGCCDTHIYVACGKVPWTLVAINIQTGEQKTLLTATERGNICIPTPYPYPGAYAEYVADVDSPVKYYWLWHGQAIPKVNDTPPWPPTTPPWLVGKPAAPEVYMGQTYPDLDRKATLWYRLAEDGAKAAAKPPANASPEDLGWKKIIVEAVETYPLEIHRLINLPDGRIFGTGAGYKGRFVFDPKTKRITPLGDGGASLYALVNYEDKLLWSGYPKGSIYVYDPARPWTLREDSPPGKEPPSETSPASNPRRVNQDDDLVFKKTRVKKMLEGVLAADGKVYFGGMGQRDYDAGGLAWYDPKSGEIDGMWEPFKDEAKIWWLATALEGRDVVISTRIGKVAVYDTLERKLVREFTPAPGIAKTGPFLEVAPGRILGTCQAPGSATEGIIYGANVETGEILFRKTIPYRMEFPWGQGISQDWDFVRGPDGFIWMYMGKVLVKVDPRNAQVHVVGKLEEPGRLLFNGGDLYLAGTTDMRRLPGLARPAR